MPKGSKVDMEERYPQSLNRFIYLFFFQFCSTLIPRPIQKFFSVVVGDLFYLLMRKTRANVRKNIEGIRRGGRGRIYDRGPSKRERGHLHYTSPRKLGDRGTSLLL